MSADAVSIHACCMRLCEAVQTTKKCERSAIDNVMRQEDNDSDRIVLPQDRPPVPPSETMAPQSPVPVSPSFPFLKVTDAEATKGMTAAEFCRFLTARGRSGPVPNTPRPGF